MAADDSVTNETNPIPDMSAPPPADPPVAEMLSAMRDPKPAPTPAPAPPFSKDQVAFLNMFVTRAARALVDELVERGQMVPCDRPMKSLGEEG